MDCVLRGLPPARGLCHRWLPATAERTGKPVEGRGSINPKETATKKSARQHREAITAALIARLTLEQSPQQAKPV